MTKTVVTVINVENGDRGFFVNGDCFQSIEASQMTGVDLEFEAQMLANSIGVPLHVFHIKTPSTPDWTLYDVFAARNLDDLVYSVDASAKMYQSGKLLVTSAYFQSEKEVLTKNERAQILALVDGQEWLSEVHGKDYVVTRKPYMPTPDPIQRLLEKLDEVLQKEVLSTEDAEALRALAEVVR